MAVVQSVGMVPCFIEAWMNSVNVGVNSSASVLSSLVGMRSGPVALCSLSRVVYRLDDPIRYVS